MTPEQREATRRGLKIRRNEVARKRDEQARIRSQAQGTANKAAEYEQRCLDEIKGIDATLEFLGESS